MNYMHFMYSYILLSIVVKRDILFELEQLRDAQLAELREKRAKEKQTNTASNENQTNVIDKSVESKTENASNAVVDKEEVCNFMFVLSKLW